ERGLLCLAWPEEFGGRGASVWEQTVVREEMWAHHEPRGAQYMGVNWVGPAIMRHGTAEQKAAHLPPIARGEVIWCQGFSEPDAGSGLASLRTAARRVKGGGGAGGAGRGGGGAGMAGDGRRWGRRTRVWRSGASCWPGPRRARRSSTA